MLGPQPVQTKEDRAESDGKVIGLKLGTANATTLYPREEGSVGVSTRRLQLAQKFRKEGYRVLGLQDRDIAASAVRGCLFWWNGVAGVSGGGH